MTTPPVYRIRVEGLISPEWQDWLSGMIIQPGRGETSLLGRVADNSALYGLLNHLASLNLTLISVERIEPLSEFIEPQE